MSNKTQAEEIQRFITKAVKSQSLKSAAWWITSSLVAIFIAVIGLFWFIKTEIPNTADMDPALTTVSNQLQETIIYLKGLNEKSSVTTTQQEINNQLIKLINSIDNVTEKAKTRYAIANPIALTTIQVLGTTIMVAILGALGMARLRNLDKDIHEELRKGIETQFSGIKAELELTGRNVQEEALIKILNQLQSLNEKRIEIIQNGLNEKVMAIVSEKLAKPLEAHKAEIDAYQTETFERLQKAFNEQTEELKTSASQIITTIQQFPWLKDQDTFDQLSVISTNAAGIEKQIMALTDAQNTTAAKQLATEAIHQGLYGDPDDFHNLYVEVKELGEGLAEQVLEQGLEYYPSNANLNARQAELLASKGKYETAEKILLNMLENDIENFFSSSRPMSALITVGRSIGLSQARRDKLIAAFEQYLENDLYEVKWWGAYCSFLRRENDWSALETVADRGLKHIPHTSYVNYYKAEILLRRGDKDCLEYAEKALTQAYDENYQTYAQEAAIEMTLAQAYELNDQPDDAKKIYHWVMNNDTASRQKKEYAGNRITALDLIKGVETEIDGCITDLP